MLFYRFGLPAWRRRCCSGVTSHWNVLNGREEKINRNPQSRTNSHSHNTKQNQTENEKQTRTLLNQEEKSTTQNRNSQLWRKSHKGTTIYISRTKTGYRISIASNGILNKKIPVIIIFLDFGGSSAARTLIAKEAILGDFQLFLRVKLVQVDHEI